MSDIAGRITAGREARGWTQAQLAERVPCNPQTISNWETGRRQPRYADLLRLAELLGRPVSWFLGEEAAGDWGTLEASFERIREELGAVGALLRRRGEGGGEGLVPITGYIESGPRSLLVDEPLGWRLLSLPQGDLKLYEVRGDSHHPLLQAGDLIALAPAAAASPGQLVAARMPDGQTIIKLWAGDGRLHSVNPLYAPLAGDDAEVTGVVAWQWRDFGTPADASVEASERLAWVAEAERRVEELEQRIERGDGQWSELLAESQAVAAATDLLRPVFGARAAEPAARALAHSARALAEVGRYGDARRLAEQAERYFAAVEQLGHRSRAALNNLYNLSQLALFEGELEAAERAAEQAAECDDWTVRWKALKNVAEIRVNYRGAADDDPAAEILALARAHEADEAVEASLARALAHEIRGNAWFIRGEPARALSAAEAELAAAEAAGLPYRIATALLNLAQYRLANGDTAGALAATERAAPLTREQQLGDLEAMRLAHRAAAEAADDRLEPARRELLAAFRQAAAVQSPRALLFAELAGMAVARAAGDADALADHVASARDLVDKMGMPPYLAVIERLAENRR